MTRKKTPPEKSAIEPAKHVAPKLALQQVDGPGPHRYAEVVQKAQLEDILLVGSSLVIDPSFFGGASGKRPELSYAREVVEHSLVSALAASRFEWKITARLGHKQLLEVKAEYMTIYGNLDGCDEGAVRAFVERVGTIATYPYFRALVAQFDWAAKTGLPPLPVITAETFQ